MSAGVEPVWSNDAVRLYHGDARAMPLDDASVHCCVTSPPYWGQRDYGLGDWEGGDDSCDHLMTKRPDLVDYPERRPGVSQFANNAPSLWPKGLCGKCGAKRIPAGIGLEPTLDEHIENIMDVFADLHRVLRCDGTVWFNYGDSYAGSWGNYQPTGKGGQRPKRTERFNRRAYKDTTRKPPQSSRSAHGLAGKQLLGIPWRIAFALQEKGADVAALRAVKRAEEGIWNAYYDEHADEYETPPDKILNVLRELKLEYAEAKGDSWWVRSAIIWAKQNPIPESVRDRPTSAYETVFLLTKSPKYFYDGFGIRTIAKTNRWPGIGPQHGAARNRDEAHEDMEVSASANARNVWTLSTQPSSALHFARMPDKLATMCVLAGTSGKGVCAKCGAQWKRNVEYPPSPHDAEINSKYTGPSKARGISALRDSRRQRGLKDDQGWEKRTVGWDASCGCGETSDVEPAVVLDPFVGSGTTVAIAQSLGRRGVGVDMNLEYLMDIAKPRIAKTELGTASLI